MKYICHMFERCWTRVALYPSLIFMSIASWYSCIVVALPSTGKIILKLLMKADQAVVSQLMLVITPDTTTVCTPNTNNLSLRLVSWNASYVVFSIIVSSLTRHFFISVRNQFPVFWSSVQWAFIPKFDNVCIWVRVMMLRRRCFSWHVTSFFAISSISSCISTIKATFARGYCHW